MQETSSADKICEISVALPAALAPKVEWIRFPPAPYKVFSTPSRDSFEVADAQNAKNACHFKPKNMVTGSMKTPIRYKKYCFADLLQIHRSKRKRQWIRVKLPAAHERGYPESVEKLRT